VRRLIDYLTPNYKDSPETVDWQNALQVPIEKLWAARDDYFKQLDPMTATWGLDLWERTYGIKTDTTKPYEYRRTRIISKMRGQGTATAEMIRNVAASFADTEVEVIEHPQQYHFEVKFTGRLGTPPNLDDLTATVKEIKPAHLTFGYLYSYLLIRDIHETMTLEQIETKTLDIFAF